MEELLVDKIKAKPTQSFSNELIGLKKLLDLNLNSDMKSTLATQFSPLYHTTNCETYIRDAVGVVFGWYVLEYDYLPMTDHANKHDLVYSIEMLLNAKESPRYCDLLAVVIVIVGLQKTLQPNITKLYCSDCRDQSWPVGHYSTQPLDFLPQGTAQAELGPKATHG